MKVALFGGTGFVGSYLVDELLGAGHRPVLLVRPGSERRVQQPERCTLVGGDVEDPDAVRSTLLDCEACIYNIGILREVASRGITFRSLHEEAACLCIDIAREVGTRRFVLMSANGARPDGTAYQRTKYQAEEHLRQSGLDGTVFRPSVIFGDPRGRMEFCTQLRDQLIRSPLPAPLFYPGLLPFGAGEFELAPIHVRDVAGAFVRALTRPETFSQVYGLCGTLSLSWRSIIELLGRVDGVRKLALPVPALLVRAAARVLDRFPSFPITADQLTMLLEGNTCDSSQLFALLGITPTPFEEGSLAYLRHAPAGGGVW